MSSTIKFTLLLGLFAACLLNTSAMAQVYGRIDLELARTDDSISTGVEIKSNSSRVGLKGSQAVDGVLGLDFIYQIEFQISPNEPTTNIKRRNSFVGFLSAKYGKFLMGTHDTAMKKIQGSIDVFSDTRGDLKYTLSGDNRLANVLHWQSPQWQNRWQMYVTLPTNQQTETLDLGDTSSIALVFNHNDLTIAVGSDSEINDLDSLLRISLSYKINQLQIGIIINSDDNEMIESDGTLISVKYDLVGAWQLLGQITRSSQGNAGGIDNEQTLFGGSRKLNKNTEFSIYYADENIDGTSATALAGRLKVSF